VGGSPSLEPRVSQRGGEARRTTFAALLRGVNVGGRKLVMSELCAHLESLGHEDVVSYIQSGNVVFRSAGGDRSAVSRELEEAIAARFGLEITVLLRTYEELAAVAQRNPFLARTGEPSRLHVLFLASAPAPTAVEALDANRSPGDEFAVVGAEAYLYLPNGYGPSKLTLDYFERQLDVAGTARNWNTLLTLVELTRS
jgi:uncharacterized protein (DUF1697 family)